MISIDYPTAHAVIAFNDSYSIALYRYWKNVLYSWECFLIFKALIYPANVESTCPLSN